MAEESLIFDCLNCLIPIVLVIFGLTIGITREGAHFKSLLKREAELYRKVLITNLKTPPEGSTVISSSLAVGSVVIASDFFKSFVANLVKLVGDGYASSKPLWSAGDAKRSSGPPSRRSPKARICCSM